MATTTTRIGLRRPFTFNLNMGPCCTITTPPRIEKTRENPTTDEPVSKRIVVREVTNSGGGMPAFGGRLRKDEIAAPARGEASLRRGSLVRAARLERRELRARVDVLETRADRARQPWPRRHAASSRRPKASARAGAGASGDSHPGAGRWAAPPRRPMCRRGAANSRRKSAGNRQEESRRGRCRLPQACDDPDERRTNIRGVVEHRKRQRQLVHRLPNGDPFVTRVAEHAPGRARRASRPRTAPMPSASQCAGWRRRQVEHPLIGDAPWLRVEVELAVADKAAKRDSAIGGELDGERRRSARRRPRPAPGNPPPPPSARARMTAGR
jgi:hypothetical protein